MDISSFYNLTSDAVKGAAKNASTVKYGDEKNFNVFLDAAKKQINETNSYIHDEETEEIKFALGLTQNTHDLSIAQAKAQTAIQYTVALRDRFLESYKEIMQMQI